MNKLKTLEEVQSMIDNIYGEGIWTILEYKGNHKPCVLRHKCGALKPISFAKNIKHGKLLCSCSPMPEGLKNAHEKNTIKKEDFQKEIDSIYGEGVWNIVNYEGTSKPVRLEHKCGKIKPISRGINARRGTLTCECEKYRSFKDE